MKTIGHSVSAWVVLCLFSSFSLAQLSTGSLSGTVADPNGLVIVGATVKAKHDPTGREYETISSEAGLYAFPGLEVGPYTLTVQHPGFKKLSRSGIVIAISSRSVVDFKLEVGEVSQVVEVTAEAPLLAAASSDLGTAFQPKFMKDAPLTFGGNLRSPEVFIMFTPGVNNGPGDSSINGGSRRSKEVLIDGAGATIPESGGVVFDFPAVEQFGEFKVLTNNFSAEYGRTGGGIEIFATASGSNEYHGTVFDFHRNNVLDANSWAGNAAGRPRTKYRQNEFGVAVGGPVWVPKIYYGRNKTFFFFTFNGYRQNDAASTQFTTIATARMRQGDFSELVDGAGQSVLIYDPLTRQPFPGNIIPQSRFSTVSRNILPFIPQPTNSSLVNNFLGLNRTEFNRDMYSIKIDHAFSDRNRLSVYINRQERKLIPEGPLPGALSAGIVDRQTPQNYRFNHDFNLRPNLLNHITFGITYQRQFFFNPVAGTGIPQRLGLKGVEEGDSSSFPVINFTNGLTSFANTNGGKTRGSQFNDTYHFRDDVSWIKGRHEFKFGFDIRRLNTFGQLMSSGTIDDNEVQGVFNFANFQTASPAARATTGHAFASFLLGLPDLAARNVNQAAGKAEFGYYAGYIQDNFKVNSKLTLNLGLRYDLPLPRQVHNDQFTSFDPNLPNPAVGGIKGGLAYAGEGPGRTGRKRFADIDYKEFGPRFGVAYVLNEKTVLRGGYGIYYGAGNGLTGGFCLGCAFGFAARPQLVSPDGLAPALNWDNGFTPPPGFVPPPFIDPSFANSQEPWFISPKSGEAPRFQNWNFNIQRELPGRLLVDVAYAGMIARRLNSSLGWINQVDPKHLPLGSLLGRPITDPDVVAAGFTRPYPTFVGTLAQALRPFPQYQNLRNEYEGLGKATYHSYQMKVERRYSDFNILLAYTFSKTLSNGSSSQTSGNIFPQNNKELAGEKSYQLYDTPHLLNFVWTWDLPLGAGRRYLSSSRGVVNKLTTGWTLAAVHQYRSGNLLRIQAPANTLAPFLFNGQLRPNVTGQPFRTNVSRTDLDPNNPNTSWINRDAYSIPTPFTFGNGAPFYGDVRNPMVMFENVGIIKRTYITETVNVEYRAEMNNVFNRTCFGGIQTNLNLPNFGRPTGPQVGARSIQMVLKVNF